MARASKKRPAPPDNIRLPTALASPVPTSPFPTALASAAHLPRSATISLAIPDMSKKAELASKRRLAHIR